jgi:hypothetical protein
LQQTANEEFTVDQWAALLVKNTKIDYEQASVDAEALAEKIGAGQA